MYRVNSKRRIPDPRRYPRPGESHGARIGNRGGRSTAEVVSYLDSLKPPKGA